MGIVTTSSFSNKGARMATHGFKKVLYAIGDVIQENIPSSHSITHHGRIIGISLIIAGGLGGGYLGYRWYVSNRERAAQALFATYEQDYFLASGAGSSEEWKRVSSLFEHGYSAHSNSNLAPYFLLFQADAQLKQGDTALALQTLDSAIQLASASPLVSLMKMKRALITLDSADEAVRQQGLDLLIELARNKESRFNDAALFYLGRYYWEINKPEEAQKAWQELVDAQIIEKGSPSPWVHEAKTRLKQLVS